MSSNSWGWQVFRKRYSNRRVFVVVFSCEFGALASIYHINYNAHANHNGIQCKGVAHCCLCNSSFLCVMSIHCFPKTISGFCYTANTSDLSAFISLLQHKAKKNLYTNPLNLFFLRKFHDSWDFWTVSCYLLADIQILLYLHCNLY